MLAKRVDIADTIYRTTVEMIYHYNKMSNLVNYALVFSTYIETRVHIDSYYVFS